MSTDLESLLIAVLAGEPYATALARVCQQVVEPEEGPFDPEVIDGVSAVLEALRALPAEAKVLLAAGPSGNGQVVNPGG